MDRRQFLFSSALAAALGNLPASIARALDIPAASRTGTLMDVEHVVILTQENRSFDHYFGTLSGVRGFSDRFPIPIGEHTVFTQPDEHEAKNLIAPFPLNSAQDFKYMRTDGTPHTFPDAQKAWNLGRMDNWPDAKHNHSLGYFSRADIPFQFALAEAFTICDAYHCALHAGTDPNRLFIWTGTHDPSGEHHGPVITNKYDTLGADPDGHGGYTWVTYPERLTAAGVSWQIYQNMDDNFSDNPLAGFKLYRLANKAKSGPLAELAARSLRTRDLDKLKEDVLADRLPQVSWVVATEGGSEHPGPSSPAQGADYTSRVLDALTANPDVWAKTVFLINFDENDGYFDHVPPPAVPSKVDGVTYGESQVDTAGEYHTDDKWKDRPYGLGPRVPLYVISPWSKGGFVNSQVFDHTSVIRFLEARFGVHEPNISAWRRAVCGDLTSCFDFASPNTEAFFHTLPETKTASDRADKLGHATPKAQGLLAATKQESGQRPIRPLPYDLDVIALHDGPVLHVEFINRSPVAVVFHVYTPQGLPLRYTVSAQDRLKAEIDCEGEYAHAYILAPGGFNRIYHGWMNPKMDIRLERNLLTLRNTGADDHEITIKDEAYGEADRVFTLAPGGQESLTFDLTARHNWYDFSVGGLRFGYRFAGHIENGQTSMSDPALGGDAVLEPWLPV